MSSYVFMKLLESIPQKYDTGISVITLGKLPDIYKEMVEDIREGERVLDVGCGTGSLSILAARKGAFIDGIDINAGMLEVARQKVKEEKLSDKITFYEKSIAELIYWNKGPYDYIISGLCFSEIPKNEILFSLKTLGKLLKPKGMLIIGDESKPRNLLKFAILRLIRIPFSLLTYLISQTTTRPLDDLTPFLLEANFTIKEIKKYNLDGFKIYFAEKQEGE